MAGAKTKTNTARPVPWLVFYGTRCALVWESTETGAFMEFLDKLAPHKPKPGHGRVMPPHRDEVHIRRLAESDRDWVVCVGTKPFLDALDKIGKVAS